MTCYMFTFDLSLVAFRIQELWIISFVSGVGIMDGPEKNAGRLSLNCLACMFKSRMSILKCLLGILTFVALSATLYLMDNATSRSIWSGPDSIYLSFTLISSSWVLREIS